MNNGIWRRNARAAQLLEIEEKEAERVVERKEGGRKGGKEERKERERKIIKCSQ
jgi:hypothetical protein